MYLIRSNVRRVAPWLACLTASVAAVGQDAETMKAVRLHAHGTTNEGVRYEDAPIPAPAAGELKIEVHAASLIAGDWKLRNGVFGDLTDRMPFTMGFDVSGVVVELGEGVEAFEVGDEVFAYLPGAGAFAEYAVGPANVFAHKPANVTHEEAAGAPVSALAAWTALLGTAGLERGQTVLIQGGAGGVGHYAVQIADWMDCTVITTASARNHEFLESLGADVVIDYRTEQFEDVVSDVDVVLEMIGGDVLERSYQVLKPGGIIVTLSAAPSEEKLEEYGIRGVFHATPSDGATLALVAEQMEAGVIKTHISEALPLSDTAKGLEMIAGGHTRGKIIIKVR